MVDREALRDWFHREVMPLEPALTRFLRRNWRNESEIADLRQELYTNLYDAARGGLPRQTKPFLFTAARNLLINRAKRARIISMEQVADLEHLPMAIDPLTPERHASAREELRRVQAGLERLPPRCREAVLLRKVEGLSVREVAIRMGLEEDTVQRQMTYGVRALVDFLLGGSGKVQRTASAKARADRRRGLS